MAFEAKLPSTCDNGYVGFEVNSGGSFASIVSLFVSNNVWKLRACNRRELIEQNVTLNNPDVYAKYTLVYDPPVLELWQAPANNPSGFPLTLTNTLLLKDVCGKGIPFLAIENTTTVYEFRIGNIWVFEIPPMRHLVNLINASSIGGGGEVHFDLDCSAVGELALTARATYGASATSGIRVYLLAGDGSNWDSENTADAFTYFEPSFSAGATRQRTVNIDPIPKYLRVLVRNLDASNSTGAVKIDAVVRGVN
jgi:hypothetical protein